MTRRAAARIGSAPLKVRTAKDQERLKNRNRELARVFGKAFAQEADL